MPDISFATIDASALVAHAIRIVVILAIAWIAYALIARGVRKAISMRLPKVREETQAQLDARSNTISGALNQAIKFVIILIALIAVLSEVGIDITPLLAGIGVLGLAIGFAAQGIVRDYIHGMFILMEDWYRVGEVALLAGDAGLVEELGLRKTVLRAADGTRIIIPNSSIGKASNLTRDFARISLDIGVAYGTDVEKAFTVINRVGEEMKADGTFGPDLTTAPNAVRVNNLGDSAIEIRVMADTKPGKQWGLAGEFRKRLLVAFDAENIEIPWPHMKVYFGNSQESVSSN